MREHKPVKNQVLIMRHPVLMEDEGRNFFVNGPMSREEAETWIKAQKGEYFQPGDYYIVEK